jgi:hypothetical protein
MGTFSKELTSMARRLRSFFRPYPNSQVELFEIAGKAILVYWVKRRGWDGPTPSLIPT